MIIFQACRIPDSKATADQWKAEIGLEKGCSPPKAAKYNPAEHNPVKPNPVKPAPQTTIEMEADSYLPDETKTKVFLFELLNKPRICLIFRQNQKKYRYMVVGVFFNKCEMCFLLYTL